MDDLRLGERIGTSITDAAPLDEGRQAFDRFNNARWVREAVITAVLRGAGYDSKVEANLRSEDGDVVYGVYARPPIRDASEAQRLGAVVADCLQLARNIYPAEGMLRLGPKEMDTFIPVSLENTD